jgi:hypothetical protein
VSEDALGQLPVEVPEGASLVHFKLVGIGPLAQTRIRGKARAAKKLMGDQPNFYVYASRDDIRAALHAYVDRFCDAQGV